MRSKWSLRGFEPQFFHFWRQNMILMKKKQWKKQDLNLQSSSLKLSAIPTELSSLVIEYTNILLYWLIHHQTKHMKSNKYTIYHEICIYAKPLTQIPFFAWIYNSFIISHLLEWLKVRQIKSGIRVNFDQCACICLFPKTLLCHQCFWKI